MMGVMPATEKLKNRVTYYQKGVLEDSHFYSCGVFSITIICLQINDLVIFKYVPLKIPHLHNAIYILVPLTNIRLFSDTLRTMEQLEVLYTQK